MGPEGQPGGEVGTGGVGFDRCGGGGERDRVETHVGGEW